MLNASGNAANDQKMYIGVYRMISEYNGRYAYKLETDRTERYLYLKTSPVDNLNLWVSGPQLGGFIGGIRNTRGHECVHDADANWLYASRSGIWKQDDATLGVTCVSSKRRGV